MGYHNYAENLCFSPSEHVTWLCRCEWPGFDMTIVWHVVGYCIGYELPRVSLRKAI